MTMITLDELDNKIEQDENLLADIRELIADLRAEIKDYKEYIAMRGSCEEVKGCPDVKTLWTLYRNCIETENRLGDCKERKLGIAQNGVAFDLNAARASIGCKLDSLRACCGSEPILG